MLPDNPDQRQEFTVSRNNCFIVYYEATDRNYLGIIKDERIKGDATYCFDEDLNKWDYNSGDGHSVLSAGSKFKVEFWFDVDTKHQCVGN